MSAPLRRVSNSNKLNRLSDEIQVVHDPRSEDAWTSLSHDNPVESVVDNTPIFRIDGFPDLQRRSISITDEAHRSNLSEMLRSQRTYDELRSDSQTPESSCDSESLACESASEQEVGITPEAARSPSSSSALKIQLRSGRSCSPGGLERQASSVSASATVENQGDERNKSPASSIWYYVNDIRASRGFRYLSIFMATLFVLGGIIALTWYLCNSLEKSLAGQVNSTCVEICRNKTIPKSDVSEAKSAVHKIFDWVFVHGPQSPVPIKTHLLST